MHNVNAFALFGGGPLQGPFTRDDDEEEDDGDDDGDDDDDDDGNGGDDDKGAHPHHPSPSILPPRRTAPTSPHPPQPSPLPTPAHPLTLIGRCRGLGN